MFSLRRITTAVAYARPAGAISTSTLRYARPQNLAELRSFESLLAIRYQSNYGNEDGGRQYGGDREGGRQFDRPRYNNNRTDNRRQFNNSTPTKCLYVGNLPYTAQEQELRERFAEFGTIEAIRFAEDLETGQKKGYGWIEFADVTSAAEARDQLHAAPFQGRPLTVQYVSHHQFNLKPNPPSQVLFLGNLPFNMTDEDLTELFKPIEGCVDVRIAIDRRTGKPRGFAHADFVTVEACEKAREALSGTQVYGRTIRLDFSQTPQWKNEDMRNRESSSPAAEEAEPKTEA